MNQQEHILRCSKCILLYESEIMRLPADILTKAIERGKRYKRAERIQKWERQQKEFINSS